MVSRLIVYIGLILIMLCRTATFDEININYISIFSMITFLLPHFLKLGVSQELHRNLPKLIINEIVARAPNVLHTSQFRTSNASDAYSLQLLRHKSCAAQSEPFATRQFARHKRERYGDHPTVRSNLVVRFVQANFCDRLVESELHDRKWYYDAGKSFLLNILYHCRSRHNANAF